jgi:hypothetical protein
VNNLPTEKRTSELAIASLALGIVSLFIPSLFTIKLVNWEFYRSNFRFLINISETLGGWAIVICAVPVILSLLFGWISLVKMGYENTLRGKPFAIIGIVCSSAFILFFLYIVIDFFFTGFK